jgi:tyrosine phenol-lyase
VVPGNILFPSTRAQIEMLGAKVVDVIIDAAHELGSEEPFKGDLDMDKLEGALRQHGRENVSCIYIELSVNACGGQPVSLANLKECKALARSYDVPLFLDASRIVENGYQIKERESGYTERSIKEIIHEICGLADGMTLSALKDLLVPAGGMIGTRDQELYQKAAMQSFLDGVQPPGSVMEMIAIALREIFATESYISHRVQQVDYLWRRLVGAIPVVHPPGGHAVFIDVSSFLPHVAPADHRAEALAAFIYQVSGVRLTKGAPPAPSQVARGIELLRLAVPARKYIREHMDDVAEALLYAHAHRHQITGLREVPDSSKSKYEPRRFTPL